MTRQKKPQLSPIPDDLLTTVMEPYQAREARYLQTAQTHVTNTCWRAEGRFSIGSSSYIRNTGHFNAAEFVICFNQLFYALVAHGTDRGLIPELRHWDLDEFQRNQLPSILIRKLESAYLAPIDGASFTGTIVVENPSIVERRRRYVHAPATVHFTGDESDTSGKPGTATGTVDIAILLDDERVGATQ
ncbi:FcoT family thioesterase [Corynebacterium kroppenstedtii]|uniref:FcoT family thioesterase n=1 Tax=Corynebacterium sp. PCR 32 TaxID=3351342 RepID=UPI0030AE47B7